MSELDIRSGALELPAHGPGRALGQKRKPQLRLSMGYRDEARQGAPVKTDYFLPRGDDRAITKFLREYGDRPRAVDIRLPGSLEGFLDIRHVAFAGGYLRAIGHHNFATRGHLGGPDRLTIFRKPEVEGELMAVDERTITGVADPAAIELDVFLRMQVSFGIPNVLGFGGLCQVTTRGKESMDTLWETAADVYGQLGSYAMVAVRPKLVLRESTMLTPGGIRAQLWVLDLWMPESLDQVYERLERHHALVPAHGAAALALMYGAESGEQGEPTAALGGPDKPATPTEPVPARPSLSEEPPSPPDSAPTPDEPEDWPWPGLEPSGHAYEPPPAVAAALQADGTTKFPHGKFKGRTLADVAANDEGRDYLKWAARDWEDPPEFVAVLRTYAAGLPT